MSPSWSRGRSPPCRGTGPWPKLAEVATCTRGLVDEGIVATRQEAKIAVLLGAMYGSTTGDSGRLVPRLRTSFPAAMGLVDSAAEVGAAGGGLVSTWLGRTSPVPGEGWRRVQSAANQFDATPADENRARRAAGDQGRFTRNFVVQGTAAEWALASAGRPETAAVTVAGHR